MKNLSKACEEALERKTAEKVSDTAIFFGKSNPEKLDRIGKSYAKEFNKRWLKRVSKEQEAEKQLADFVITH